MINLPEQAGLKVGVSRWGLDINDIENIIILGFPELVFIQAEQKGVHLTINIVKLNQIPEEDQLKPIGHLIADCDGIIEDILVRRGTAAVQPGDTVMKCGLLIYCWQGDQTIAVDNIVTTLV